MKTEIINVVGMSCQHCVNAIETSVKGLEGVFTVEVELSSGSVTVVFDTIKVGLAQIEGAISEHGYDIN